MNLLLPSAAIIALILPGMLIVFVGFLLKAFAVRDISDKCGLKNSYFALIPVLQSYQIGAIADYASEKPKSKFFRLSLFISNLISVLLLGISTALYIVALVSMGINFSNLSDIDADLSVNFIVGQMLVILLIALIASAASTFFAVVYYIALYKIFKMIDPSMSLVYILLSIFITFADSVILFLLKGKFMGKFGRYSS